MKLASKATHDLGLGASNTQLNHIYYIDRIIALPCMFHVSMSSCLLWGAVACRAASCTLFCACRVPCVLWAVLCVLRARAMLHAVFVRTCSCHAACCACMHLLVPCCRLHVCVRARAVPHAVSMRAFWCCAACCMCKFRGGGPWGRLAGLGVWGAGNLQWLHQDVARTLCCACATSVCACMYVGACVRMRVCVYVCACRGAP
jgi:hypothetical protein